MRRIVLYGLFYFLAVAVAFICIRIEWLNVVAGGKLPGREYRNQDPEQGPVTWRSSPITSEAAWRRFRGPKDADLNPVNRPLTLAEATAMGSDINQTKVNNALGEFVGTAGLLQYLLAPALVFASILVIRVKGPRYGVLPLVIAVSACALMLYRAYFTSLG